MSGVDGNLKVYGLERLRIADGSIMPHVTTGNTIDLVSSSASAPGRSQNSALIVMRPCTFQPSRRSPAPLIAGRLQKPGRRPPIARWSRGRAQTSPAAGNLRAPSDPTCSSSGVSTVT